MDGDARLETPHLKTRRLAEIWSCLDGVTDPELDEPLTDLGFIEDVSIASDDSVDVAFRLPTYWCSTNFAFLMAEDIRRAVLRLGWVSAVRPRLRDHMNADEISDGTTNGLSFGQVFRDFETADGLDAIRETFRRKAFERRQEAIIRSLRTAGYDDAAICTMTLAMFDDIALAAPDARRFKQRYREILFTQARPPLPDDTVFATFDGVAIDPGQLKAHLQTLRAVRINMEFNSALCRSLLDARYQSLEDGVLTRGSCGSGCATACSSRAPVASSPDLAPQGA